jgi:acyl-CoA reductase-like NAD-dependent aldehyde dehydrogenase
LVRTAEVGPAACRTSRSLKNPRALILADADLAAVAKQAAQSRFLNRGQSCLAAKRFEVEEPVADEFERRFVEPVTHWRWEPAGSGHPLSSTAYRRR